LTLVVLGRRAECPAARKCANGWGPRDAPEKQKMITIAKTPRDDLQKRPKKVGGQTHRLQ